MWQNTPESLDGSTSRLLSLRRALGGTADCDPITNPFADDITKPLHMAIISVGLFRGTTHFELFFTEWFYFSFWRSQTNFRLFNYIKSLRKTKKFDFVKVWFFRFFFFF